MRPILEYLFGKKSDLDKIKRKSFKFVDLRPGDVVMSISTNPHPRVKYTSKASFLDKDPVPNLKDKSVSFSGKRIKRGLYRTKCGSVINADINGAGNIMRKEVGDVAIPADRGLVFSPLKISF